MSCLNRPELVDFDLGHVLVPFSPQKFYDYVLANQPPGAINPERFFGFNCVTKFDLGFIDKGEFCRELKRRLCLDVGDEEFLYHYCDIMKPDFRMLALKGMLKENGFKLAVVSNINHCHFEHVQKTWPEVFSDFDYLALSFQLHARKPNFKMYRAPSENLGVPPERCFLIDDLKINIDAFERWGGVGHHYNVTDENFFPNGRLETQRNRLLLRMVNLGMLSLSQASSIARIDLAQLE